VVLTADAYVSVQRQYILAVIEHASRRIRVLGTTAHPTADRRPGDPDDQEPRDGPGRRRLPEHAS
jgi:hypothetical protein